MLEWPILYFIMKKLNLVYQLFRICKIKFETRNVPEWANAVLDNPQLVVPIDVNPQRVSTNLRISVDETAPGQKTKTIEIVATAEKVNGIGGEVKETTSGITQIEFIPAYSPALAARVVGESYQQIGPMDTANFDVELPNLANAKIRYEVIASLTKGGYSDYGLFFIC